MSSTRRQAGVKYVLLDSGAHSFTHVRSSIQEKKVPLLDSGIHTATGARLQHDGGRVVTFKLPEGRAIRVLFHACDVQKPIPVSWLSRSAGVLGVMFAQTLVHCSFLTRSRRKRSHTQLHNEGVCLFFLKGMLVEPLSTAGVSGRSRSRVTDADWSANAGTMWSKPIACSSCNTQMSRHSRSKSCWNSTV